MHLFIYALMNDYTPEDTVNFIVQNFPWRRKYYMMTFPDRTCNGNENIIR